MNRKELAELVDEQRIPLAVYVTGKVLDQPWVVAAGMADAAAGRPMSVDTPLRVASNTKTFVAATVLRLWERGLVDLDGPIAPLVTPLFNELLAAAGYHTDKITVRHLLDHSGGLVDHTDDPEFFATVVREPQHFWTREEQVHLGAKFSAPLSDPGTRYSYSDTGYILLGDIVERISGTTLAATVRREMAFDRLGLATTWWEISEPEPAQVEPRARQFFGDVDATEINASMDLYGGGGLVMSARDLATFFAALFEGRVFDSPDTLREMLSMGTHEGADSYRLGIAASNVDGSECYSHLGFWGTAAYYSPTSGIAIAGFATSREARGKLVSVIEQTLAATLPVSA
ncbi:D-alanyl-D-alanine carboxypeptidase [Aminobacter lissarensis]|uniref:D-alanyl-D-alanine carboxypeptidase n=1 Tax=Aminobacter carboxidus TaxID=376165 RepID=A0A8E2BCC9_9HYPH|nr:serine hydrolase domain-containing protein [Aminobacter lissarensis]MBB6466808.1 D-alanyl-D-alanine carboxypeptidase [Aminobacter lissarensis]